MVDSDKSHVKTFIKESSKLTNISLNLQLESSQERFSQPHTI